MADDLAIGNIARQMADPARHQIENRAARRKQRTIEFGDSHGRLGVDMGDEARRGIENMVRRLIFLAEGVRRQLFEFAHGLTLVQAGN